MPASRRTDLLLSRRLFFDGLVVLLILSTRGPAVHRLAVAVLAGTYAGKAPQPSSTDQVRTLLLCTSICL